MLCPQGRQACAQGVYTLALLLASACAFLVSCTEGSHNPSETDLSAFGEYVLPIIRVNVTPEGLDAYLSQIRKRCNRSLREIAQKLEFPESQQNITIYTARHSFAMTLQTAEKPIEIISQALGHQSVETTKHYLAKFSTTKMAEETDINLLDD